MPNPRISKRGLTNTSDGNKFNNKVSNLYLNFKFLVAVKV